MGGRRQGDPDAISLDYQSRHFKQSERKAGSDRFCILCPVNASNQLSLQFTVERVNVREEGFAVHYDFSWHSNGEDPPAKLAIIPPCL